MTEECGSCLIHGVGNYWAFLCAVLQGWLSKLGLGGTWIDVNGGYDVEICSQVCYNRG